MNRTATASPRSRTSPSGLFRDRDFRRLCAATALGQLGDRVLFLALPLVAVVALEADEFEVGLLTAMTAAGSLLVGLPAGAWVDRMRKRPVLICADLTRAVVLSTIPVAWWVDALSIGWLYTTALLHSVLTVFFDVAYVSWLPHLVGRERLVEGNAKLSAIRSVTSVGGPTVAGPLVGAVGAPVTVLVSAAGMAASGLLTATIRTTEPSPTRSEHPSLTGEIRDGLGFVLADPILRATVLGDAIFNLSLVMYQTMLMVHLARDLALDSLAIGLVLSGMGCGALLGALLAGRAAALLGQGRVIWLAPLVTCPLTALMPLARPGWSLYAAALGLAALSLGGVVRVVAQSSLQQSLTPDHLLGRMNATARFVSWGGIPLGGVLGGGVGAVVGPVGALWVGVVGMTVSALPAVLSPLRRALAVVDGTPRQGPFLEADRG